MNRTCRGSYYEEYSCRKRCVAVRHLEDFGVRLLAERLREPVPVEAHDGLRGRERSLSLPRRVVVFTLRSGGEQKPSSVW